MEGFLISAWLDLIICIAYISIPLQLVFVATRQVTAIDFRKITGNMTTDELALSRKLLFVFALFILCCGFGHGIRCHKAFTEDSLLTVMEKPLHIMTAVVSVGASVLLAMSMPSFLTFCNSIEIHRKGYLKVVMEDRMESGQKTTTVYSSDLASAQATERELRNKVTSLERRLKQLSEQTSPKMARQKSGGGLSGVVQEVQESCAELSQDLRPLPNLLGKCFASVRPNPRRDRLTGLSHTQILQLISAAYVLRKARPRWGTNPDETWGDFSILLKRILRKKLASNFGIPPELWMEICEWCASMTSDELTLILETVIAFANSPQSNQVVKLADVLIAGKPESPTNDPTPV